MNLCVCACVCVRKLLLKSPPTICTTINRHKRMSVTAATITTTTTTTVAQTEQKQRQQQRELHALALMFAGDVNLVRKHLELTRQCAKKGMPAVRPAFWLEQDRASERTVNDAMFFVLVHCHCNPRYNELLAEQCKSRESRAKFACFCRLLAHAFMCLVSGLSRDGKHVQRTSEKWVHQPTDFVCEMRSLYLKM